MKQITLTMIAAISLIACTKKDNTGCYTCRKVSDTIAHYPATVAYGHLNYWYGDTTICGDTAAVEHFTNTLAYADSVQKTFTDTAGTHTYWAVYRTRVECLH